MSNCTISGPNGNATFVAPVASFDEIANNYWDRVEPDGPEYQIQEIAAGGVDGVAVARDGFRNRDVILEAIYVGASRAACRTAQTNDEAIVNQACSIVVPDGATLPACECKSIKVIMQPTATGYGTFWSRVLYTFQQKRTA